MLGQDEGVSVGNTPVGFRVGLGEGLMEGALDIVGRIDGQ